MVRAQGAVASKTARSRARNLWDAWRHVALCHRRRALLVERLRVAAGCRLQARCCFSTHLVIFQ